MKATIINYTDPAHEALRECLEHSILHALKEVREEEDAGAWRAAYIGPYRTYSSRVQLPEGVDLVLEVDYYPVADGYMVKAALAGETHISYNTVDIDVPALAGALVNGSRLPLGLGADYERRRVARDA